MNDMNVLVDPENEDVVAVGIDRFRGFGCHTALVADVAIVGRPDRRGHRWRVSISDVVMAYHATTPLLPQELAMLNPLIAGRLLADVGDRVVAPASKSSGTHYADLGRDFVGARSAC